MRNARSITHLDRVRIQSNESDVARFVNDQRLLHGISVGSPVASQRPLPLQSCPPYWQTHRYPPFPQRLPLFPKNVFTI